MTRSLALGLALASLVFSTGTADADEPVPPKPHEFPLYAGEDMALSEKAVLPKGWALVGADAPRPPAEKALSSAAAAAATSAKADPAALKVALRSLTGPAGKTATVALVDVDVAGDATAVALDATAKKAGWTSRRMGPPQRVLLLAAPPDAKDALLAAQLKWAAVGLSVRADALYQANHDPHGCLEVCAVALSLDPKSAPAHFVARVPAWGLTYVKNKKGPFPDAIAHVRAALSPDASYPLSTRDAAEGQRNLVMYLLMQGGGAAEARDILLKQLKDPASLSKEDLPWARYNLACALGQLGEKDEPLRLLTQLLSDNEKEPQYGMEGWREDGDFAHLHDDARWKALLAKYPEQGGDAK